MQAGDLAENLLETPHELEGTLRRVGILERVQVAEARMPDDSLVDARVVLHRAGAQRIEARVDPERARGKLGKVANELGFGDLGEPGGLLAAQLVGDVGARQLVVARQRRGPPTGLRLLVDEPHPATSARTSARWSISAGVRFSVTQTSRASSIPG